MLQADFSLGRQTEIDNLKSEAHFYTVWTRIGHKAGMTPSFRIVQFWLILAQAI